MPRPEATPKVAYQTCLPQKVLDWLEWYARYYGLTRPQVIQQLVVARAEEVQAELGDTAPAPPRGN